MQQGSNDSEETTTTATTVEDQSGNSSLKQSPASQSDSPPVLVSPYYGHPSAPPQPVIHHFQQQCYQDGNIGQQYMPLYPPPGFAPLQYGHIAQVMMPYTAPFPVMMQQPFYTAPQYLHTHSVQSRFSSNHIGNMPQRGYAVHRRRKQQEGFY